MSTYEFDPCVSHEAQPLSRSERRWLRRLERVLKDMPERVRLVEVSDGLVLVDREAAVGRPLYDHHAHDPEVFLADVEHSFFKVTGVSA